jgi:hypothetical protein
MGEEPALELDAGLDGAFARQQFVQGGFGAIDEGFVVEDRGFESRDEFKEVGLAFDEVGEELGILRDQGTELFEERLLAPSPAGQDRGSSHRPISRHGDSDAPIAAEVHSFLR